MYFVDCGDFMSAGLLGRVRQINQNLTDLEVQILTVGRDAGASLALKRDDELVEEWRKLALASAELALTVDEFLNPTPAV